MNTEFVSFYLIMLIMVRDEHHSYLIMFMMVKVEHAWPKAAPSSQTLAQIPSAPLTRHSSWAITARPHFSWTWAKRWPSFHPDKSIICLTAMFEKNGLSIVNTLFFREVSLPKSFRNQMKFPHISLPDTQCIMYMDYGPIWIWNKYFYEGQIYRKTSNKAHPLISPKF